MLSTSGHILNPIQRRDGSEKTDEVKRKREREREMVGDRE